jgi:hypothetical protein
MVCPSKLTIDQLSIPPVDESEPGKNVTETRSLTSGSSLSILVYTYSVKLSGSETGSSKKMLIRPFGSLLRTFGGLGIYDGSLSS